MAQLIVAYGMLVYAYGVETSYRALLAKGEGMSCSGPAAMQLQDCSSRVTVLENAMFCNQWQPLCVSDWGSVGQFVFHQVYFVLAYSVTCCVLSASIRA